MTSHAVADCSCGTPHRLDTTCDVAAQRVTSDARHMRMILELIAEQAGARASRLAARAALEKTKDAPWVTR